MDPNSWSRHCIEASLAKLTLSTKCIKQSASFLLTMPEHADVMSRSWLNSFKSAVEPATQLALLYVLNEIIMKCESYGAPDVKGFFQDPLIDAIKYLRPGLLIKKVKKLITMWADQKVYEPKFTHQLLRNIINIDQKTGVQKEKQSDQGDDNSEIVKDFPYDKLIEQLRGLKHMEDLLTSLSEPSLNAPFFNLPIDVVVNRMKNKDEGRSLSRQIINCSIQLESTLRDLKGKLTAQEQVSKLLEKAELFYSIQQKEAVIVANAYKAYGQRVRSNLEVLQGNEQSEPVAASDKVSKTDCQIPSPELDPPEFIDEDDDDDDDYEEKQDFIIPKIKFSESTISDNTERENLDPFGLSVNRTPVDSLPFSLRHISSFPFNDAIMVDSMGDVDYRPMFAKMKESHQKKSSSDFDGRISIKPSDRLILSGDQKSKSIENALVSFTLIRASTQIKSPTPLVRSPTPTDEDNMEMSDEDLEEAQPDEKLANQNHSPTEKTVYQPDFTEKTPVTKISSASSGTETVANSSIPSVSNCETVALTDTGDYDWRKAKQISSTVSDTTMTEFDILGSTDADLRFLPRINVPATNTTLTKQHLPPTPEEFSSKDFDHRNLIESRVNQSLDSSVVIPTSQALSTPENSWISFGDRDFREKQPIPSYQNSQRIIPCDFPSATHTNDIDTRFQSTFSVSTIPMHESIRNPFTVNANQNAPPFSQPVPWSTSYIHQAYSIAQQPIIVNLPPPPPPPVDKEPSLSYFSSSNRQSNPPVTHQNEFDASFTSLNQNASSSFLPLSNTISIFTSQSKVDLSEDLLSSLRKINLPVSSSQISSSSSISDQFNAHTYTCQSNAIMNLLRSIQTVTSESQVSSASSKTEDPFSIISRLTGLSSLIQNVRPTASVNSESNLKENSVSSKQVNSPQYTDTSSDDSLSPIIRNSSFSNTSTGIPQQSNNYTSSLATMPSYATTESYNAPSWSNKNADQCQWGAESARRSTVVFGEDNDDEEGGATPTQDESDVRIPVPSHYSFKSAASVSGLPIPQIVLSQQNYPVVQNPIQSHIVPPQFPISMGLPPPLFNLLNNTLSLSGATSISLATQNMSQQGQQNWMTPLSNHPPPPFRGSLPIPTQLFPPGGSSYQGQQITSSFPQNFPDLSSLYNPPHIRVNGPPKSGEFPPLSSTADNVNINPHQP